MNTDSSRIVYEKPYYIKTGNELENYILEEYSKDDVELSSLFFDVIHLFYSSEA